MNICRLHRGVSRALGRVKNTHRRPSAPRGAQLDKVESCSTRWTVTTLSDTDVDSHDRAEWRGRLLAARGRQVHVASVERNDRCAIAILDARGTVVAWHDHMPRAQPYDPGVLNHHMSQFYLPEDVALHVPASHLSIAAEYGLDTQCGWRRRPGGEIFWGVTVIQSILVGDGELLGYSHVTRPVRGPAQHLSKPLRAGLSGMAGLALA